jgi:hypothetical protein
MFGEVLTPVVGARMADAFARAFARGAERVVLVGTDAPGVARETAIAALSALDAADVVIGPAEDGGYYLIALREPRPELFAGVAWSTPSVREETRARAAAAGLSVESSRRCATSTPSRTSAPGNARPGVGFPADVPRMTWPTAAGTTGLCRGAMGDVKSTKP